MNAFRLTLLPLLAIAAIQTSSAAKMDETAALGVLSSDAATEEKARACQQLAVVGGPKSVPALAALLADEKLASHARSGLETIKDPAAGDVLRQALPKLKGEQLIGTITSLGVRRDTAAVPDLQKLVADPKNPAAEPALAALGQIASDDALATLRKILVEGPAEMRVPAAHAALVAAGQLVKDGKRDAAPAVFDAVNAADVPAHIKAAAAHGLAQLKAPPAAAK